MAAATTLATESSAAAAAAAAAAVGQPPVTLHGQRAGECYSEQRYIGVRAAVRVFIDNQLALYFATNPVREASPLPLALAAAALAASETQRQQQRRRDDGDDYASAAAGPPPQPSDEAGELSGSDLSVPDAFATARIAAKNIEEFAYVSTVKSGGMLWVYHNAVIAQLFGSFQRMPSATFTRPLWKIITGLDWPGNGSATDDDDGGGAAEVDAEEFLASPSDAALHSDDADDTAAAAAARGTKRRARDMDGDAVRAARRHNLMTKLQGISDALMCPVCRDVPDALCQSECNHLLCMRCAGMLVEEQAPSGAGVLSCPSCRGVCRRDSAYELISDMRRRARVLNEVCTSLEARDV